MVFSSYIFLFAFLPIFLTSYFLVPRSWRNSIILISSCIFYAWGESRFIFFLLSSCCIDYILSRQIHTAHTHGQKRLLLTVSLILNISVLAYAKYANFFVGQYNAAATSLGGQAIPWVSIALPLGVSFFTFHKISYIVDIYRGIVAPAKTLWNFLLYILLFPQLIAGPIVRYHDVADQIEGRNTTETRIVDGAIRFCHGLGKKVLIANPLGRIASAIFAMDTATLPPLFAWAGILCYAFQIYFDFSGYSDMAIGLARILGFRFLENFNHPYIARSITDFWRRWHISLSNFMREYVYIPLGGNRVSGGRMALNLIIVFALSGIWHGANWTFLVWGLYQGFFIVLDRTRVGVWFKKLPGAISIPWTFLIVIIGWVFFRSDSLAQGVAFAGRLFSFRQFNIDAGAFEALPVLGHHDVAVFIVAWLISFLPAFHGLAKWAQSIRERIHPWIWACTNISFALLVFACSVLSLNSGQFNPFIYYRF